MERLYMYLILWQFHPKAGREKEFESIYGPDGEWARFFRRGEGYVGTQLLREVEGERRYLTVDTWTSQAAYETFRRQWSDEYAAIDRKCASLTEREVLWGYFLNLD